MGQRYTKPILGRYRSHSLHGQFCGHQFLIPDLKAFQVFNLKFFDKFRNGVTLDKAFILLLAFLMTPSK